MKKRVVQKIIVLCTRLKIGQGYYPKKSMGMGWVEFVSEFLGYFWVGYQKRLVVSNSFGYQTHG